VRGNTETERWVLEQRRSFDRLIAAIVAEAQASGQLRADIDAALATRLLFGMLNSITEWYRPEGGMGAAQIADAAIKIAFEGLR